MAVDLAARLAADLQLVLLGRSPQPQDQAELPQVQGREPREAPAVLQQVVQVLGREPRLPDPLPQSWSELKSSKVPQRQALKLVVQSAAQQRPLLVGLDRAKVLRYRGPSHEHRRLILHHHDRQHRHRNQRRRSKSCHRTTLEPVQVANSPR